MDLSIEVARVKFKNPIVIASGSPTKDLTRFKQCIESGAGGFVAKSVTDDPCHYEGLTRPQYTLTDRRAYPYGFTNYSSAGAADFSPDDWVKQLAAVRKQASAANVVIIGSINCKKFDSWARLAKMHEEAGCDMLEINFGSPVTAAGFDKPLGSNPVLCAEVVASVRAATKFPLFIKVSAESMDPMDISLAVKKAGADGICLINRYMGLDLDLTDARPLLRGGYAGVGGPWMLPIMLKYLTRAYREIGLPLSATSGIWLPDDAIKAILCGASTVQLMTAITHSTRSWNLIPRFLDRLQAYCEDQGYEKIDDFRGKAVAQIKTWDEQYSPPKGEIYAELVSEKCSSCGSCPNWCFYDAITLDQAKKPLVDRTMCNGCGACISLCPKGALSMAGRHKVYL